MNNTAHQLFLSTCWFGVGSFIGMFLLFMRRAWTCRERLNSELIAEAMVWIVPIIGCWLAGHTETIRHGVIMVLVSLMAPLVVLWFTTRRVRITKDVPTRNESVRSRKKTIDTFNAYHNEYIDSKPLPKCTCTTCPSATNCEYAFDSYNTDGDCLYEK